MLKTARVKNVKVTKAGSPEHSFPASVIAWREKTVTVAAVETKEDTEKGQMGCARRLAK